MTLRSPRPAPRAPAVRAPRPAPRTPRFALVALLAAAVACTERGVPAPSTLVVYNAGSLARPLRAALDSFGAAAHVTIAQEN
ncbi:MAG TPA: hypothetical protein VF041_02765, partial [Gemmatimonadaceae bacterium]